MFIVENLFKIAFEKPGSSWLLGNITPAAAAAGLVLPFLAGAATVAAIVFVITYKKGEK